MKYLLISITLIFSTSLCLAQEFAPVGAKWYVEVREPFTPNFKRTLTNQSLRDTVIKGLNCKILFKSQRTIFNEILGEYSLCQKGDSIYHYIKSLDSLNLVMNFAAEVGDSWESFDQANNYESFGFENNYKYRVDSIGFIYLPNGDSLKVQYLTEQRKSWTEPESSYSGSNKRELIQQIGFKKALLPTNGGDGFTDDQFETIVRCYEDESKGLIKFVENEECLTSSVRNISNQQIQIYPNPASDILNIKGLNEMGNTDLNVIDLTGKILLNTKNQNEINVRNLNPGIYILHLKNKEFSVIEKFVISR